MKYKRPVLAAGVISLGLASMAGFATVSAQTSTSSDSLVDKLVSKFNLNKDEVQAVFDEAKTEREAERQAKASEKLQQSVEDGYITAEQKTLIESKMAELKETLQTERKELEAWAESQGVDMRYLMMGHGMRGDDRLDDAVEDGDITAEQRANIEAKQAELQDNLEAAREALEQWAEENDIDTEFLRGFGRGGMHFGPGGVRQN